MSTATFRRYGFDKLEWRVGARLFHGMSDDERPAFEPIIERNIELVTACWDTNAPVFLGDPIYVGNTGVSEGNTASKDVVSGHAATNWREVNRPDRHDLVKKVIEVVEGKILGRAAELIEQSA